MSAAAPLMQTEDASVGQVVDGHTINNMALNGRNFTFLAQLAAGVNTPQADTRGNAATGAFAANGNRPAQNNYLLDGIDNNSDTVDFLNGTNFVVLPPVEAIQEFKVQTSGFSAEFGRSGAAVLNATIKSGTNSLHGAAWEFFRNDNLDAADWFENCRQRAQGRASAEPVRSLAVGGPDYQEQGVLSSATTKACAAFRAPFSPVRFPRLASERYQRLPPLLQISLTSSPVRPAPRRTPSAALSPSELSSIRRPLVQ